MKVLYSHSFYPVYTYDPAAVAGRIEAVMNTLPSDLELIEAEPATEEQIALAHTMDHIEYVRQEGLYEIAALAAGGAIQAARLGLETPTFGAIRPPGHHASNDSCWGFCYFNNMAVALLNLKNEGLIKTATILDFDLHYGDGTANILGHRSWVTICNPTSRTRDNYLDEVLTFIEAHPADTIGISAGFDHHQNDWGGLLHTQDYHAMGRMVINSVRKNKGAGGSLRSKTINWLIKRKSIQIIKIYLYIFNNFLVLDLGKVHVVSSNPVFVRYAQQSLSRQM